MGDIAGWVLLGIAVLVFAYIVPAAIRTRQVVASSRADDRYSGDLRIVTRAGDRQEPVTTTSRVFVHASANEEALMSSPVDRQLAAADARRLAAARAARAAASSRRAAAARRRLVLIGVLLLASAGTWTGFALLSWPVVAPIVVTVALVAVVALGRRAAALGAAADARWEKELEAIVSSARRRATTTVRAAGKPALRVDVDPTRLIEEPASAQAEPRRERAEGSSWTPVPVPPPAYTLKQQAPRREVNPLDTEAPTEQMAPVDVSQPTSGGSEEAEPAPAEAAEVQPAMDIQAVLARRRAAG